MTHDDVSLAEELSAGLVPARANPTRNARAGGEDCVLAGGQWPVWG